MGRIAFLFPGQGSQTVGMGQSLRNSNDNTLAVFKRANEKLQFDLTDIIENGPEEKLRRTEYAQPALVTMSIAVLELLKEKGIKPDFVAGHSLGEYSALVCANVLSFEDAVYAVHKRGLYMEEAMPFGEGAMSAVLGLERDVLQEVCDRVKEAGLVAELANLNCPGQIVISGSAEGIEKAGVLAKEAGAKRVLPLQVSGPFHSSLMMPCAKRLEDVLANIPFYDAEIPVVANVSAKVLTDKEAIKASLVEQVYSPVLWEDTILTLLEQGVDTFIEVGNGQVLTGLVKKVNRRVQAFAISDEESLAKALEKLEGGNR